MPANATYVRTSIEMLAAVLASSSSNAAHIQLTMPQKSIQSTTVLKHRRTVEDLLLKSKLVPDMHTTLLFERPESSQNDRRNLTQTCILSTFQSFTDPAFLASMPAVEGRLGPFPLIKVANMLGCDEESRKGVPLHGLVLDAYFKDFGLQEDDRAVFFDMVPNRQCEFARAAVTKLLEGNSGPQLHYVGLFRPDQYSEVKPQLCEMIYKWWDDSPESPPKARPADGATPVLPPLSLGILAVTADQPVWPQSLDSKFEDGTEEKKLLMNLKKEFLAKHPAPDPRNAAVENGGIPWRLTSDKDFVSMDKKTPEPLCQVLRSQAVNHGLASVEAGGGESQPISFRFDVAPSASLKTHLFKPHPVETADKDNLRAAAIGAVFHNQYARVINNKRARVVWEANITNSPAKLMPVKPKVYLLATVRIPAQSWVPAAAQKKPAQKKQKKGDDEHIAEATVEEASQPEAAVSDEDLPLDGEAKEAEESEEQEDDPEAEEAEEEQPPPKKAEKKAATPKLKAEAKNRATPKAEAKNRATPKAETKQNRATPKAETKNRATPKAETKNRATPKAETKNRATPKAETRKPKENPPGAKKKPAAAKRTCADGAEAKRAAVKAKLDPSGRKVSNPYYYSNNNSYGIKVDVGGMYHDKETSLEIASTMLQSALQKKLAAIPNEAEAANAMAEQLTEEQAECVDAIETDGEGAEEAEGDESENEEGADDAPLDLES
ncbi:fp-1 [Symbiodinium sp. KB8]|nr:fp-1 [Symbiodinium sp. KB8]